MRNETKFQMKQLVLKAENSLVLKNDYIFGQKVRNQLISGKSEKQFWAF